MEFINWNFLNRNKSVDFIGGYKGDEEGYEIPTGTDIFISVSY